MCLLGVVFVKAVLWTVVADAGSYRLLAGGARGLRDDGS